MEESVLRMFFTKSPNLPSSLLTAPEAPARRDGSFGV